VHYAWGIVKIKEHAFIACCSESKCKEKEEVNCTCVDAIVTLPFLYHLWGTVSSKVFSHKWFTKLTRHLQNLRHPSRERHNPQVEANTSHDFGPDISVRIPSLTPLHQQLERRTPPVHYQLLASMIRKSFSEHFGVGEAIDPADLPVTWLWEMLKMDIISHTHWEYVYWCFCILLER